MRDLRIVFMGTPDFAVQTLKVIVESGYKVVGVITAPDKPAGRGRKLTPSAVKEFAMEQGLPLLQPTNLKSEAFLNDLKAWKANLQVVVAFRMLPKQVWELPQYGTFNLHASLLPQYRGAAPINWAIINGETATGVSTFFIDEKIDTGAMILQQRVEIDEQESAGSLHDKLMHTGAGLVIRTLEAIAKGPVKTTPQPEIGPLKTAYKLDRDNTRINWQQSMEEIYNHIRGLSPFPTAWTSLSDHGQELTLKIYKTSKVEAAHRLEPGKLIQENKQAKVAVTGGFLMLEELQLPGKRKMKIKELLNGYTFSNEAMLR